MQLKLGIALTIELLTLNFYYSENKADKKIRLKKLTLLCRIDIYTWYQALFFSGLKFTSLNSKI